VWQAPPTPQADRQELVSLLVTPIALTPVAGSPRQTQVPGLWHTTATTELWGPRPSTRDRLRTPPAVVDTLATLAAGSTAAALAAVLTARGLPSGRGPPFTAAAVAGIRDQDQRRQPGSAPRMAARLEARPDGRASTRALAMPLGGTIATVHSWRAHGRMPALQETPGGPWWHLVTPAVRAALRQHLRRGSLRTDALSIPNAH
jgi:hypothetical protein